MNEEVKKILKEMCLFTSRLGECGSREQCPNVNCKFADEYTEKICQLFEPKPDDDVLVDDLLMTEPERLLKALSKPDEGRLPTDEEFDPQAVEFGWFLKQGWIPPEEAKEKDAECQARVEDAEFWILEYFRYYARQLELKHPHPSIEEQEWLGYIWDMIKLASQGEWQARKEGVK